MRVLRVATVLGGSCEENFGQRKNLMGIAKFMPATCSRFAEPTWRYCMTVIRPLLSDIERAAQRALIEIVSSRNWQLFCVPKFSDVIEVSKTGLNDDDFNFATRAHIDFVLTDDSCLPRLAIELDCYELRDECRDRALKKDRLAHHFGLPMLRIDLADCPTLVERDVKALVLTWLDDEFVREIEQSCGCGNRLCFNPECIDLEALDAAMKMRKRKTREWTTDLIRETKSDTYSTTIVYNPQARGVDPIFTYTAVTVKGGISHTDLAQFCANTKARNLIAKYRKR
jgi:hypothetical protein